MFLPGQPNPIPSASAHSDVKIYNEVNVKSNHDVVDYCRTSLSIIAGCTAGILGLTGLSGFGFYIVASLLMTIALVFKAGKNWEKYFTSRTSLWWDGVLGGIFSYILFWTFLYGVVHVF